jgi:hypothetical protein
MEAETLNVLQPLDFKVPNLISFVCYFESLRLNRAFSTELLAEITGNEIA